VGSHGKKLDVELRLCDYRDVHGTFDRVWSIGMMSTSARRTTRDDEGDRSQPRRRWRRLVHTIGNNRSLRHGTPWIEKYIFPNAVARRSVSSAAR